MGNEELKSFSSKIHFLSLLLLVEREKHPARRVQNLWWETWNSILDITVNRKKLFHTHFSRSSHPLNHQHLTIWRHSNKFSIVWAKNTAAAVSVSKIFQFHTSFFRKSGLKQKFFFCYPIYECRTHIDFPLLRWEILRAWNAMLLLFAAGGWEGGWG